MDSFVQANQTLGTGFRDRHSETGNAAAVNNVTNAIDLSDLPISFLNIASMGQ